MVVDILRAQPGESLTNVLYTPATTAQVSIVTELYISLLVRVCIVCSVRVSVRKCM